MIILNISMKGGDYSREAIGRGTAIISGNTVPLLTNGTPFTYLVGWNLKSQLPEENTKRKQRLWSQLIVRPSYN